MYAPRAVFEQQDILSRAATSDRRRYNIAPALRKDFAREGEDLALLAFLPRRAAHVIHTVRRRGVAMGRT